MVRQADDGPKNALAATTRRQSSVPRPRDQLDDVPQLTSMLAAAKAEFVLLCDLI
jgi:hypothetical protein